jgi:sialic acid synthase SpsE
MIFVAEIGSNHKGIPAIAHEMIRQSALAGADIAKFQLGHDMNDPIRSLPMRYSSELKEWCDHYGIEFMASIFNSVGFDIAESIGQERYKFPSRKAFAHHSKVDYDELLQKIVATGKEVFLSDDSHSDCPNVRNLFIVPEYPLYPESFRLPEMFDKHYGYSSHVHGYADALIAVARGARYIEKHVTLNKTERTIKDNAFALSFDEFAQMVSVGRDICRLVS